MTSASGIPFRPVPRHWILALVLALICSALPVVAGPGWVLPARAATPCDPPVVSKVACENTLAGNPASEWQVSGAGDSSIQGYATSMSVNVGQTVTFKVKTNAKAYRIDVYRFGYYQGSGARKVAANILPSAALPQTQPSCLTFSATGLIDCGNWAVSASWAVPATAVSGVYIARLVRTDTGGASVVPFVVRDDAAKSAVLFQTSDTTWQAYNSYGGNSLYTCSVSCPAGNPQAYKAAFKVSYNRPFHSAADDSGRSWLMYAEYPMIRFLESNGYDISYMSGLDVATKGSLILNHKSFLSAGHDEYWSADQRTNVTAARDAGVNLAFFSGNEMFWKTRWEPSADGTNTAGRTLVSYKDTHFNAPTDPVTWTGTWRDPRFGTANGGGNPENSLTGQYFMVNSGTTDIVVPAAYKQLRLWRGTSIPAMASGASVTLGSGLGTLGYEWDSDAVNGFRPAGSFRLSQTTNTAAEVFTDYGSTTKQGATAVHNLTMYKAASGAIVFGAGTVQWSWGLDPFTTGKTVDRNMQQATVNLFADMSAQPATLISGLSTAQPSTDTTAPTSAVSTPAAGTSVADGTVVTVSGTASDVGGVVAGVEVSTDGGATWQRANGTTNWTFSWNAHGSPTSVLRSRAVDDSGNLESGSPGVSTSVTCPCSVLGRNISPSSPDAGDPNSLEIGAKFYSDVAGTISGIRFYKSAKNTGTHVGNVWSVSGQRLATVTFSGESASGWQTALYSPPLAITAGTQYVVSYFAPAGHYAEDPGYFYNNPSPSGGTSPVDSAPLHFTRSVPNRPNGFYKYGTTSAFPDQVYDAENYWVDPIFTETGTVAPAVSSVSPINGANGVDPAVVPAATFNQAVAGTSVVFTLTSAAGAVPGTVTYDAISNTSSFHPNSPLAYATTYTATVSGATNSAGQAMASPYTWQFTTASAPAAPVVASANPSNNATNVTVDVKPSATFDQAVTPGSIQFTLKNAVGAGVGGATSYDAVSNTVSFTPSPALSYGMTYTATVSGATNSTGQTMTAPYTWSFATAAPPATCPCTVFDPSAVPLVASDSDTGGVELGMKFRSDAAGTVTGVRFYKGTANTGSHTGHLWSSSGALLASLTFSTETSSGWQQATFSSPVSIAANTTYIVSYYAPRGGYSADSGFFSASADRSPLHGLASGVDGPNGVYRYGTSPGFPTDSFNNTNYWVDVVFSTSTAPVAPAVTASTPADAAAGQPVATKPTATFNQDVVSSSINFALQDTSGTIVPGSVSYDATTYTATFAPSSALAYGATFKATVSGTTNVSGQSMGSPYTWSFSTAAAPATCPCTVFSPAATPATITVNDSAGVELGMKFRSDVSGNVTGIRFYKGTSNTGTHTGHLWSSSGTLLASLTFSAESASGWQEASFTTPVAIAANTTYIVSYYAPRGFYSASGGYFTGGGADNPPLHGLASGVDGLNGIYRYGASFGFPADSYNDTNYWVDVVFATP